jgi:hypothetical protein
LPAKRQHPVQQVFTRSIKRLWINFDLNTYSIPLAQLGRPLLAEADDSYVSIFDAGKLVVRHPRSYGRGEFVEAKEHRSELIEKRQFGRTNFFRDQITRDFPDIERLLEHMFNLGHDAGTTIKRIYKLRESYGDELFAAGLKLLVTNPTPSLSAFHVLLMQLESKNKRIPDVKLVLPNNPKVQDLTVKSHSLADYDELF